MLWRGISVAAGLLLMAAPGLFDYGGLHAALHHIIGPSVASVSTVALWQAGSALRWLNLPLAVALVVAPVVSPAPFSVLLVSLASAVVVVATAWPKSPKKLRQGGGWRAALRAPSS